MISAWYRFWFLNIVFWISKAYPRFCIDFMNFFLDYYLFADLFLVVHSLLFLRHFQQTVLLAKML